MTGPRIIRPRESDPPLVWAEYYLSLGWALSHFAPGTKGPQGKGWNTPGEWIDTPAKAAATWGARPTYGMGVIHAGSGTAALDVDDIDATSQVFAEFGLDLAKLLASAPRIRGKRTGRDKAIFRAPEGVELKTHKAAWRRSPTDILTLFELRAGDVHDVLPPSQHPDGHRYEWRTAPWDFDTIPTLPPELLDFWREFPSLREQINSLAPWAEPLVRPALRALPSFPSEGHNDVIGAYNRATSVHALLQAHGYQKKGSRYLAPSSKSRIPGVSVLPDGRVYSHHGSDVLADGRAHDAFDLFTIFQHRGDEKVALLEASRQLDLPVYGAAVPGVDFSELLAVATKKRRAAPVEAPVFPRHLLTVPGLVGDFTDYINASARYPQPILALAAAISASSTLMGRKVRTESDLRTNVYVLGVAEAGAGKEHARQIIRQVFDRAGAFGRVAVEGLASEAGLVAALTGTPSSLFMLDEIGRFLNVLQDQRAGSHLSEIITQLLRLWSSANTAYAGKVYADPSKNIVIQQPNLSIYGTTVPGVFHASLSASQVEDGFLSRLLVFESDDPDPEPVDVTPGEPPHALIEQVVAWEAMSESPDGSGGNVGSILRPHPRTVHPDAEARLIFSRFDREMRERRKALREANQNAGLYVRTHANALKLALIRAAGLSVERPLITREDAAWGCELALYLADSMAWRILAHVAENQQERNVKKVAAIIRAAGEAGITRNELTRRTQWARSSDREDMLRTLGQSGEVFVRDSKGPGRPSQRYVWHLYADDSSDTSTPLRDAS